MRAVVEPREFGPMNEGDKRPEFSRGTMKVIEAETGAVLEFAMPGGRVQIKGLVARPELNGQSGSVQSFDTEKNRFGVRLDGRPESDQLLAIKMANLDFVHATRGPPVDLHRDAVIPPPTEAMEVDTTSTRIATADAQHLLRYEDNEAILEPHLQGEEREAARNFMLTERMVFDAVGAGDADKLADALDNGASGDRGGFPVDHREHDPRTRQTLLMRAMAYLRAASKRAADAAASASFDEKLKSVLRVLIKRGANPNLTDAYGGSALTFAALAACDAEIATMLLDAGADPTHRVPANFGKLHKPNALEMATEFGNKPFADVVKARMPAAEASPHTHSAGKKQKHERRRPTSPGK